MSRLFNKDQKLVRDNINDFTLMQESEYISIFENIYSKHLRRIEFYAYNFTNDMDEAKSIAHDVFLKLWEKRKDIDLEKDILPYLIVLTRNNCLNSLKIKKNFYTYIDYRIKTFNLNVLQDISTTLLLGNEVQKLIGYALEEMKPKVKETFLLSRNKGLKNREIAEYLDISISTVEFRIASAYNILRKKLKDYLPFILWYFAINW